MQKFSIFVILCTFFYAGVHAQEMTVKDDEDNILFQVNDEGTTGKAIVSSAKVDLIEISSIGVAPVHQTNKLYNLSGSLYWNGSTIANCGWSDDGGMVRLTTSADKVGIGVTSTNEKLELLNSGPQTVIKIGRARFGDIGGSNVSTDITYNARWDGSTWYPDDSGTPATFTRLSNAGFLFYAAPSGSPLSWSEVMRIGANGNVGIGTPTPQGKLDVNGAIYQRGSELHADYVFEPDYELESIEEHANFMWTNKHLRALPGRQVDENGLEIVEAGAHRRGLVEEVEKAHIYIEQLLVRIKVLEDKLEKMQHSD
ncbi:hypothetical protein EH223_19120 [candidate division KSB1 bacterium]|nr:hypothetical protein [candidate division KSB1 bacterium]RQW00308.1 MAG: hypothetical protein EH223_19120 [candidate division KSB1 bacterium]